MGNHAAAAEEAHIEVGGSAHGAYPHWRGFLRTGVPVFYDVFELDLSLYHDLGFDLFKLGELAVIRLDEFSLAGKRWEDLRQAVNRSTREQLSFELIESPFDSVLMSELEQVSDE